MLDILIAVDQPSMLRGFQAMFHERGDVRLWYKGGAYPDSRRPATAACYDVIVVCSNRSDKQLTLERISALKRRYANSSFVLMAQGLEWFSIAEYCRVGVYGFVDEHATEDQIASAISAAARNDLYVSSSIMDRLAVTSVPNFYEIFGCVESTLGDISKLSERELETLNLVAKGMSNKAIAERLFISEKTVKNHLYNVYKKLGVRDRTQAAIAVLKALCSAQNRSFGPI
jgi:two-component system response regulator DegU